MPGECRATTGSALGVAVFGPSCFARGVWPCGGYAGGDAAMPSCLPSFRFLCAGGDAAREGAMQLDVAALPEHQVSHEDASDPALSDPWPETMPPAVGAQGWMQRLRAGNLSKQGTMPQDF